MKWERLIALREKQNLSQAEVARSLGMSRSGFSMYELGKREPGMEMICKLADFFGVSADYLIGRGFSEWEVVIAKCRALALSPERVANLLDGLTPLLDKKTPYQIR